MNHILGLAVLVAFIATPVYAETCSQREEICKGHCPQRNKTAERIEKCRIGCSTRKQSCLETGIFPGLLIHNVPADMLRRERR